MSKEQSFLQEDIQKERKALLEQLQDWLETPMVVLALLWLALFVAEVIWGLTPFLTLSGYVIWMFFAIEFAVDITLAPSKRRYLQHNWLKGLALLAPALRLFRIFRLLRLFRAVGMTRGLRLLRVLSSLNRGMRALAASMGRRGFGYVVMLTQRDPGTHGGRHPVGLLSWTALNMLVVPAMSLRFGAPAPR